MDSLQNNKNAGFKEAGIFIILKSKIQQELNFIISFNFPYFRQLYYRIFLFNIVIFPLLLRFNQKLSGIGYFSRKLKIHLSIIWHFIRLQSSSLSIVISKNH